MSNIHPLHDRARTTTLGDAAQILRDRDSGPRVDRVACERPPGDGGAEARPTLKPRRNRGRRGAAPGAAVEEALALLADATQDLTAARLEIDRLRTELDIARAALRDEMQEGALMRRQRDGLQFRTDYLEEKLDLTTRALKRASAPWWRRIKG